MIAEGIYLTSECHFDMTFRFLIYWRNQWRTVTVDTQSLYERSITNPRRPNLERLLKIFDHMEIVPRWEVPLRFLEP
jgi:hypothetical protein